MNIFNLIKIIRANSNHFELIFSWKPNVMSSITLRELFVIELERNTKSREEIAKSVTTMRHFFAYLDELQTEQTCTYSDILQFATGTSSVPFFKYSPRPRITFMNGKYPMANTCTNNLSLPTDCESYDIFKQNLDCAFLTCEFGRV